MYIVTGGGDYCSNTDDYPFVGLSGSQVGILYALYRNGIAFGSPQPGNGWPLVFGVQPLAGVYTIKAFRDDCERPMQGSAIVNVYDPPVVSFIYTEGGIPDACGLVSFDVTVNGVLNPSTGYTYEWDFGDEVGTSNIPNPIYQFPAYGTGTEDFIVELKVTDANGCETLEDETVTVNQRPHAHLTPINNLWIMCNDPLAQFLLTVYNTSTTTATNTGYLIDWGDGSDPVYLTPAEFPFEGSIQHLYTEKGTFPLSLTVDGPTCNDTRVYPVFNGSLPAGGVTYQAGILEGCEPHTITFRISGEAANNAPTTVYYFNFGDGTDPLVFTQETMPALHPDGYYPIPHTYEYNSCAEPGYAYQLTHYVQNPCSTIPNDVGGIKISKAADADFLRDEFPDDPIIVYVDVPKQFTNNTSPGCIIYGNQITQITSYYWDFYNNGIIDREEENPLFTFNTSGIYEVKLTAITGEGIPNCGEDNMIRIISVLAVPQNLIIEELDIPASGDTCLAAFNNIVVSGITIASNAVVGMTAGNSIVFYPASYILEGAVFSAWIDTQNIFCDEFLSPLLASVEEPGQVTIKLQDDVIIPDKEELLLIYPNPSDGIFQVFFQNITGNSIAKVEVYSLVGERIFSIERSMAEPLLIDLSNNPSGMYLIKTVLNNTRIIDKLIIN
jgi:PKD repeat protein